MGMGNEANLDDILSELRAIRERLDAPKQWEYARVLDRQSIDYFDNAGSDGWELVAVDNGIAYFKREKR